MVGALIGPNWSRRMLRPVRSLATIAAMTLRKRSDPRAFTSALSISGMSGETLITKRVVCAVSSNSVS